MRKRCCNTRKDLSSASRSPLLHPTQKFSVAIMFPAILLGLMAIVSPIHGNPDAKRLYDDLMSSYNSVIRPVGNNSDTLTVKISLKLTQLIDVVSWNVQELDHDHCFQNLKNQIMATNMWVEQEWTDYKLRWDPDEYGGVTTLYVPSEQIWLPDIVLYNNADGNYDITMMTKAILHFDGKVIWNPPAIWKSACQIDIQYFPFDKQECTMKFGSWTYDGNKVDLRHRDENNGTNQVPLAIDLSEYYLNVEWDILRVPAIRSEKFYACCPDDPYPDITFNITLRRKTLFYTVNLIIPCVGISSLSFLVFYLPSDSGEKVSLTISILLSLTFFFLVLIEIIPSTSLAMPVLGQYLIFTLVMITLSILATIVVLNVHFRNPASHQMKPWTRRIFIRTLPKLLLMRSPQYKLEAADPKNDHRNSNGGGRGGRRFTVDLMNAPNANNVSGDGEELIQELDSSPDGTDPLGFEAVAAYPRELDQAIKNAMFIAHHIDNRDEFDSIHEDWKYVAMVLDRLFLWIFTTASILGTALIFLQAPSLYDSTKAIDVVYSKITHKTFDVLASEVPFPEAVSML